MSEEHAIARGIVRRWGWNVTWLKALLAGLRAHGRRFYNVAGLEAFKAKFGSAPWLPVYASLSPGTRFSRAPLAITSAFSGEPVHRFVPHVLARSLVHEARRTFGNAPA